MKQLLFGLPPLITSIIILIFGFISISRKPVTNAYRAFSGFCFSISIWAFCYGLMYLNTPENSLFFARMGYLAVVFIPTFALHFILLFTESQNKILTYAAYSLSLLFLPLSQSDLFLKGYNIFFWGPYPSAGPLYIFFVIYFTISFFACVGYLFRSLKKGNHQSAIKYNQIKFVFLAFAIASTSIVDYIANYGYEIYPYAYMSAFGWIALIAYAILRYKLMDFNLILRWGLAYVISLIALTIAFLIFIFILGRIFNHWLDIGMALPTVFSLCLIVIIFNPIKDRVVTFVDQMIFKSPDFRILIDGIETELNSHENLNNKIDKITGHLKSIWNVDHAGFVMWNIKTGRFQPCPSESFKNQIISRIKEDIDNSDFLIRTLESERRLFRYGIIMEDELTSLGQRAFAGERITFWKIRRTMRWLGAAICVPLMIQDKLLGFMVLGQKRNKAIFNDEDRKFLSHLSERVSIFFKDLMLNSPLKENYLT